MRKAKKEETAKDAKDANAAVVISLPAKAAARARAIVEAKAAAAGQLVDLELRKAELLGSFPQWNSALLGLINHTLEAEGIEGRRASFDETTMTITVEPEAPAAGPVEVAPAE